MSNCKWCGEFVKVVLFADGIVGERICHFLLMAFREDLLAIVTVGVNDIYRLAQRYEMNAIWADQKDKLIDLLDEADLGILAWWPKILSKDVIARPRLGFVNTHPSLLPFNRGKHYNFWAIVEEAPFGVTLHKVDARIDSGDIVAQCQIDYDWTDTGESLYMKAQEKIVDLFEKAYPAWRSSEIDGVPQDCYGGSFHYASELESASFIDLDEACTARHLLNKLRARTFEGYPGCRFADNGTFYEVRVNIRKVDNE